MDRNSESFDDDMTPDGSFSLALEPVQHSTLYQSLKNPKILIDVTPTLNRLKTVLAGVSFFFLELNLLAKSKSPLSKTKLFPIRGGGANLPTYTTFQHDSSLFYPLGHQCKPPQETGARGVLMA